MGGFPAEGCRRDCGACVVTEGAVNGEREMAERSKEATSITALALIGMTVGFALGALVAWIYWMQREEASEPVPPEGVEAERVPLEPGPAASIALVERSEAEDEQEPDDLTRIEGIGPKMSSVLAGAGIETYKELATSHPDVLRDVLRDEGLQFADPGTWPEQAALAAMGDWEGLNALQDQLSGGRRVG